MTKQHVRDERTCRRGTQDNQRTRRVVPNLFPWKVATDIIQRTHLLARGLVFRGAEEILVVQAVGHSFTFLPGGHLDAGESLANSLVREIAEELGASCEVEAYLGAVEHQWPENQPTDYEINHVFHATIEQGCTLVSREAHLTFTWCHVSDLDAVQLQPKPLRALIRRYAAGDKSVWWDTNVVSSQEERK